MLKLHEIRTRRTQIEGEMRTIYDGAVAANQDLDGEPLERWTELDLELRGLVEQQDRAETRDNLDRQAAGRDLEARGDKSPAGDFVWLLSPEQRMSAYVARQANQPEQRLSLGKAIGGLLSGHWKDAEPERRAMSEQTGSSGSFLVPEPLSASIIDLARNQSVMVQAGAGTIPMSTATLTIATVGRDPTGYWRGENQPITESDGSFGAMYLRAHSLAALVRVSNELLDDAAGFASTLDNMLSQALGLEMDRAALFGTGVGQALGLREYDGVNEEVMGSADGAAQANYDDLLDLMLKIMEHNGTPTTMISSPRSTIKLAKLVTGITTDLTKLTPPAEITALRKLVSNQISITETQGNVSTASTTFMGGFDQVAFGVRQQITIEMSRSSGSTFAQNQTHVRAIMRGDFAVLRPNQLGRLIGIL